MMATTKKKVLSMILALVLCLGLLPVSAFAEEGALICTMQEHTHTDGCYELTEGHTHGDSCYATTEGHHHTDACYQETEGSPILTCTNEDADHVHDASCYTVSESSRQLICGQEETSSERILICGLEESEPSRTLICTLPEHTHDENCYASSPLPAPTPEQPRIEQFHFMNRNEMDAYFMSKSSYQESMGKLISYYPEAIQIVSGNGESAYAIGIDAVNYDMYNQSSFLIGSLNDYIQPDETTEIKVAFAYWYWKDGLWLTCQRETVTIPYSDFEVQTFEGNNFIELYVPGSSSLPQTYTVTFDSQGGSDVEPQILKVQEGALIAAPKDPSKDNCIFGGWYQDASFTTPWDFSKDTVTQDITLYAKWTPDSTVPEAQTAWFFIRTDGKIPFEDGNSGYLASAYLPSHATNTSNTASQMLTGTIKEAKKVWVNYNSDAVGTNLLQMFAPVADAIQTVPSDEAIKAAVPGYDPDTQIILWYAVKQDDSPNGGCPQWHVDGVICDKSAVYVGLTYDANLPAGVTDSVTVPSSVLCPSGTRLSVAAPTPVTITDYTFVGWNTKADGSGTSYQSGSTITVSEATTLYAQWKSIDNKPSESSIARFYIKGVNTEPYTVSGPLLGLNASLTVGTGFVYLESQEIPNVASGNTNITLGDLVNVKLSDRFDSVAELIAAANGRLTADSQLKAEDYTGFAYDSVKWEASDNAYHIHITLTAKDNTPPLPAQYTVTYQYAGTVPAGAPALPAVISYAKDESVSVAAVPTLSGYTFSGWNSSDVTITGGTFTMPEANVVLTGSWTKTGPDGGTTYYTVTVNYLDQDGNTIASSHSERLSSGSSYDVSGYDAVAIAGYRYDRTTGDSLTGTMNGNKVINVYYIADEVTLDDEDVPQGALPDDPGMDIEDSDVPTGELPEGMENTDSSAGIDLSDEDVPMASVPQTGDISPLWLCAAAASGFGVVCLVTVRTKRKDEEA